MRNETGRAYLIIHVIEPGRSPMVYGIYFDFASDLISITLALYEKFVIKLLSLGWFRLE